ncbi:MAG: hypothetical protein CVV05_02595 [Gammaproteobacteria bacterium HGW-Gammaproteobacteria-1]|jgi:hypothetical protein|nr:MAG: hypothetical protein CVV05_02595 [Gammaproteobacteria bacterium HGW-Gammaproteobacteria-1]
MNSIPDFTESELWTVHDTLRERYGREIEIEQGDVELRLDPHSSTLTPCPVLFWREDGANFVISKVGDRRYRAQFFYRVHQQFGTGIDEFDNLAECTVTLLQVQADHEAKQTAKQDR